MIACVNKIRITTKKIMKTLKERNRRGQITIKSHIIQFLDDGHFDSQTLLLILSRRIARLHFANLINKQPTYNLSFTHIIKLNIHKNMKKHQKWKELKDEN